MTAGDSQLFGKVMQSVEAAESLPPWCYSSREFLDKEIETVFRRGWHCVGRADRLRDSGSYAAIDLAGVPLLLVRDDAGALRAFANSCRHRGTRLLQGDGSCRRIVCPFHSWTYALDGRLIGAPEMEETLDFRKEDYGLVPLRLETRDGFLFLCHDPSAPSLDAWLGDFSELHAPWSLGDMVTARRREIEVPCNWKLYLEVFNEYYHLRSVHPRSIAGLFDRPDPPEAVTGEYLTQFGTHEGTAALLDQHRDLALPTIATLQGRNRGGTRYTWLMPGFAFAVTTDALWMHEVTPLAPDRSKVAMTACFPREAFDLPDFETRAAAYFERLDRAIEEDLAVLSEQQVGLSSPLARPGRFSGLEPNVAAFGRWLAERVSDG